MSASAGSGGPRLGVEFAVRGSVLWIRIHGDADISTVEHLDAALNNIAPDGSREVCIELSDLHFIDVAALRRLTIFATDLRRNGAEVTTLGAPPLLRQVLQLLPGQDQLGLA